MTSSRPLRIGLVGPLPPPSGGMANQTRQLARLLADVGCAVEVVQVNAAYRPAFIERVRGLRALFRLVPYLAQLWQCAGRVDLFHVMANSGWAWHLCAAPAVWIARLRGVPVVVNYRGGEAASFLDRQRRFVVPTLRRAFALVVPSTFLFEIFARHGVTAEVVPNVVDLGRFHPATQRPRARHIVVTRNLEDIYDIPTALRAFAVIRTRHPDARMTVAGSGPCLADLRSLCRELRIEEAVDFPGRIDNERIAALYRDADLLVNPSTVDNMPNSLLEAMASGVPIVSTDVGGIPHLVTDGTTALLVPPRDPERMAGAMLRVLDEPALASALSRAGIATVARYTWPQVRTALFAVYARAVGRPTLFPCTQ